jgi:flagellar motor switch protein FliN/FliY
MWRSSGRRLEGGNVTDTLDWLIAQWTSRFREITLAMGDLQLDMHVAHMEDSDVNGGLLWWEQPFSCAPDSPIWTGASEDTWTEIGRVVLAAGGVDPAPATETQSTYLEILRQSMGSLAADIGDRMSTQVTASKGAESAPRKINRRCFKIEARVPQKTLELYVVVGEDLCQVIASAMAAATSTVPKQVIQELPDRSTEQAIASASRTFELLLDVELPVSVSFGRAVVKLQDAINLITGSLIELDRGLSDPVELLVNNCIIARGEVVVIEGNYGVRITEIVSQKERLQQTRRYMMQ